MRPLAFVDLETTGATATADRITEIGIVEVDADGTVREWQQLVNPGTRIPPFIEQLTGISNEMVAAAPSFAAVAGETLRRLEGRLFIAHNARFDYGFLKNEFKRLGVDFRAPVLCTVKLSRTLYPQFHRHNLDSLIERHALRADARHRALADAQLIHQFWQKIHVDRSSDEIDAALAKLAARPSLPPHLDPGIIDDLPEGPGVYLFYGEPTESGDLPLYVGKAKDIRKRVLSHFAADHSSAKEMALAQQLRRIDWIETAGEIGALLKEATLVKQLLPTHNRLLRKNDELCTWTLVDEGEGWLRPELASAHDLDFGARTSCYGLFKSAREAAEVLRALAAEHNLCDALLGLERTAPGKPCFGHQIRRCKGACVGREPYARHTMRLVGALARLKLAAWPVNGPALIREGDEAHLVDSWRYLGTAKNDDELDALLAAGRPRFDRDTYKILAKYVGRMIPLSSQRAVPPGE
ncbi:3'-5' exonuclease family protein [Dechloromonas sp. H13]|uniref:3'-5' exonuclease family protein n=1 Tax=Dechloromonas sp. H13 TaxID=2570193 RepID=UPI001292637C|nr:3'-5' exonuclease family protein [Dechloromonas sp. H13]